MKKPVVVAAVALSALLVAGILGTGTILASIGRGGTFMHRPEMWHKGARSIEYWWITVITPFLFLKLLIALAVAAILVLLAIRSFGYKKMAPHVPDSNAIEILKERYAKGEISKEELEAMKKDVLD